MGNPTTQTTSFRSLVPRLTRQPAGPGQLPFESEPMRRQPSAAGQPAEPQPVLLDGDGLRMQFSKFPLVHTRCTTNFDPAWECIESASVPLQQSEVTARPFSASQVGKRFAKLSRFTVWLAWAAVHGRQKTP